VTGRKRSRGLDASIRVGAKPKKGLAAWQTHNQVNQRLTTVRTLMLHSRSPLPEYRPAKGETLVLGLEKGGWPTGAFHSLRLAWGVANLFVPLVSSWAERSYPPGPPYRPRKKHVDPWKPKAGRPAHLGLRSALGPPRPVRRPLARVPGPLLRPAGGAPAPSRAGPVREEPAPQPAGGLHPARPLVPHGPRRCRGPPARGG
jgi:hypothetical protein